MSKGFCFVSFIAGVITGSLVAWQYAKKKYEKIAQEEIDSVKRSFAKRMVNYEKQEEDIFEGAEIHEYSKVVENLGYVKKEMNVMDIPYVISPDEFGQDESYETISLTYYADGVLADDDDEMVEDVENLVGFDSLNHFGEYEDDSVFVRNDRLKCDYEILLDHRKYTDVKRSL
jgi:hypothetical protein